LLHFFLFPERAKFATAFFLFPFMLFDGRMLTRFFFSQFRWIIVRSSLGICAPPLFHVYPVAARPFPNAFLPLFFAVENDLRGEEIYSFLPSEDVAAPLPPSRKQQTLSSYIPFSARSPPSSPFFFSTNEAKKPRLFFPPKA